MLKSIKIKDEKSKARPLKMYNLGAKMTGFIDLYDDPVKIIKMLKPRHFEYKIKNK